MQIIKIKKIHFIGVGGIGISALAKLMISQKKIVSGSDLTKTEITEKLKKIGIKVYLGHRPANLSADADLVIYSDAVPTNNPERRQANKLKIKQLSYFQFLAELTKNKKLIAVSGTNGKTTTTALLGQVLTDLRVKPTVIFGSQLKRFAGNLKIGKSNLYLIEADEYKAHMLEFRPWSIILTNLDLDHLDFYKNLKDIQNKFQKFVNRMPTGGFLIYPYDDLNIRQLKLPKNSISCSLYDQRADYHCQKITLNKQQQNFTVYKRNKFLGNFTLTIPGEYNILNALLVIAFCDHLKLPPLLVKKSLARFSKLWRRFEIIGKYKNLRNVTVISDYTHHPSAIAKTLKAAKEFYPNKRLFLVFQPHQRHRTKKLFKNFVNCFSNADLMILNEIYDVAGRKYRGDKKISSLDLVKEIKKQFPKKKINFSENFQQTTKQIKKLIKPHDLLIIMGAGDIDNLARELV